ncbi:hypothetical protein PF004_g12453 [Phytophthora fragariae]|uniref:Ankyrin repeat-containing domain n=1 Tax=Phytophthora fragariae TaxID=53985 RepID=A0A6G0NV24_9STRA|nr:hypothetical protein PF004_g12453 [Phytophthora fragariae]
MVHENKRLKVSTPALAKSPQISHVDTSEWPALPLLTAARLVCRERLHVNGDNSVLRVVDSFLDELSESLTLTTAYKMSGGSLRLLQYIAAHESATKDLFLRRWDVNAVTGQAAARGDLQTLKWVADSYLPGEFLTEVVAEAASNGHLHVLIWLWENNRDGGYWGGVEVAGAILNHQQDVVDWLRGNVALRPGCAQYLVKPAAECGILGVVQWIYENFELQMVDALNAAALKGQWEVMRWCLNNANQEALDDALQYGFIYLCPAEFGDLDMLKCLFGQGLVPEPVAVLEAAAKHGHLDIIKYLVEGQEIGDTGSAFYRATNYGHLDVLKYLHEKMPDDCSTSLLDAAAHAGLMEIVQWLHENTRARCTLYAMDGAAGNGHLEMMRWLHANYTEGCTSLAMDCAARRGHLDVVKWLHENRNEGCTQDTMKICPGRGNLDMVKWLHANRSEAFNLDGAMDAAAANGHLNVVQWLLENLSEGCTTEAMDGAAGSGHLDVVKWLHEYRQEGCTTKAMDVAAANGHLEMVKWLHTNRDEGCTTNAMDGAAANNYLKVVKWLSRNRSERCTVLALEWLFSKSTRLDTAVYMFSEFPECRTFHLGVKFEVAWLEVVEWLVENARTALVGCTLEVKSWNWHVCDWLRKNNWKLVDQDKVFSCFVLPSELGEGAQQNSMD